MLALFMDIAKLSLLSPELLQETYELYDDTDIRSATARIREAMHYRMVLLDTARFTNSPAELCDALSFYRSLNSTPLILLAQGCAPGDELPARLVAIGCFDFVTAHETAVFREQLEACIQGRTRADVEEYAKAETAVRKKDKEKRGKLFSLPSMPAFSGLPSLPSFSRAKAPPPPAPPRETKSIALAGVCPRIGVTTQALRLTRALNDGGTRACYLEANGRGHVRLLRDIFSDAREPSPGLVDYAGLSLYHGGIPIPEGTYDYTVRDCGAALDSPAFLEAGLRIVVAGSAAWEMAPLAEWMQAAPEGDGTRYIFSFTSESEREDILDFMAGRWKDTYFAAFVPDMFAPLSPEEQEMYRKMAETN